VPEQAVEAESHAEIDVAADVPDQAETEWDLVVRETAAVVWNCSSTGMNSCSL
jgi:hypothetical protein